MGSSTTDSGAKRDGAGVRHWVDWRFALLWLACVGTAEATLTIVNLAGGHRVGHQLLTQYLSQALGLPDLFVRGHPYPAGHLFLLTLLYRSVVSPIEWLLLRSQSAATWVWIPASYVSLVRVILIPYVIAYYPRGDSGELIGLTYVLSLLGIGVAAVPQWLVLRGRLPRAWLWPTTACALAMAIIPLDAFFLPPWGSALAWAAVEAVVLGHLLALRESGQLPSTARIGMKHHARDPFRRPLVAVMSLYAIAQVGGIVLLAVSASGTNSNDVSPAVLGLVGMVTLAATIAGVVFWFILLYRWWDSVPTSARRTSPGRAVGFCFIPVFGLYWAFVAIVGLATDLNAALAARGAPRVASKGLATSVCIVGLASIVLQWIPVIGTLWGLLGFVLYIGLATNLTGAARVLRVPPSPEATAAP